LKDGVINHRGAFQEGAPNVRKGINARHKEFLLVPAKNTGHGKDIVVTRSDVNEIQLAKGAIRAGLEILLEEGGIEAGDIDEFIIAGAFGTYLDVDSAITVGIFPELPRDRFRQVGNAAGTGAQQMLISAEQRRVADEIPERVEYIELTTHAGFEKTFMEALFFDLDL
ncbi:MAG: ASKHA domain-containing protein, partial [Chloroflexota bacterium]|nr:ASKHA domain-containing protein [Chloroflexota bacterium]